MCFKTNRLNASVHGVQDFLPLEHLMSKWFNWLSIKF